MPRLVDTTIRVLGQEPLAGRVPTADLLTLAEVLDGAGFACLEISGGGVFDTAVRRGVESPWERIRALRSRTKTPLALALRGRFLVGPRPVGSDLVRRFVASAAESGIDVFRLHDPLNDVSNLCEPAEAVVAAGKEFDAGLLYSGGQHDALMEAARRVPELGAARIALHDPAALLQPHRAAELVAELREVTGLPVGLFGQGAGGYALAAALEASRAGAEMIACASYPVALTMHRVSSEALAQALAGLGMDTGVDVERLWAAAELVDEHIGDAPVAPTPPRVAVRAMQHKVPVELVGVLDTQLRGLASGDRLDEVLDEVVRIRGEIGSPPLSAPVGQIVGTQALINVLGANRYATMVDELRDLVRGRFGRPPKAIDPALARGVELLGEGAEPEPQLDLEELRGEAQGLAASEEELLLLALFGDEAEGLLRSVRDRSAGEETLEAQGVEKERARRIRELVRIVQETGVGEITVEEEGMRVSIRRTPDAVAASAPLHVPVTPPGEADLPPVAPRDSSLARVESPMVGTFYRAPAPEASPFVEVGDAVSPGQTLCILEAMKLMNEVKAEIEAVVRSIAVDNGEPVEYGQLLFELEPVYGRPADGV